MMLKITQRNHMTKKALTLLLTLGLALTAAHAADKPTKKAKQTPQGLYLTAKEAHDMIQKDPKKVLFIDVRTPEEILFVGHTGIEDKNVPFKYVDFTKMKTTKKGHKKFVSYKNSKLVEEIDAVRTAKGLTKNDPVICICRSGDRSAFAATALNKAGYTKAYTIIEGFEGDKDKKTHKRTVNGWKNAGLPWTYKFNAAEYILERPAS